MPAMSVDLGTSWNTATARAPQVLTGLVTPSGVGTYHEAYSEAALQNGAPGTLRVGDVTTPGAPVGVAVTTDARGRATAGWAAPTAPGPTSVGGYRVVLDQRAADGGWTTVTAVKVPAGATTWRSAAPDPTRTNRLRVRAVNAAGPGTAVDTLVWTGR